MENLFYIASQDAEGGIYLCSINEAGRISQSAFYPVKGVAWLCRNGGKLYALLREPFMQQSGIISFDICADGTLTNQTEPVPTFGSIAAYITCIDNRLYAANYLSATTVRLNDKVLLHTGSGPDKSRQLCGHPHFIELCPDRETLAVPDLGADLVYFCDKELNVLYTVKMPEGGGPRHIVFSKDGKFAFCSLEMTAEIAVLENKRGRYELKNTVSNLPDGCSIPSSGAGIRLSPDGLLLYASNRGQGGVRVYKVCGGELTALGFAENGEGAHIREFNFVGKWLLCGDEANHRINVFETSRCTASEKVSSFNVVRPWCILPI